MKTLFRFCCLGLLAAVVPSFVGAALTPQNNIVGKFLVSKVNGTVTCVTDSRIIELKKGDLIVARGAVIETAAKANLIIVFSNGTGVYADEKTHLQIEKFDQEFFAPNNNLRVEPSNSSTIIHLTTGRLVVSTPRLLSGTTMFYDTAHAAIGIRGEKVLIEADEKQTHVAMIAGNATVNPRDADGNFVTIGKRLTTGQEAFVKYTLGAQENDTDYEQESESTTTNGGKPVSRGKPRKLAAKASATAQPAALVTKETEATIVRMSGTVRVKLPGSHEDAAGAVGTKLPRGALISTGDESETYLQVVPGAVALLRPRTVVEITDIAITTEGTTVKKQSSLLDLHTGVLISTIDPAKQAINEFMVKTPQGIATATGTSFVTTVQGGGMNIAVTADTVTFVTATGVRYAVAAGNMTMTSRTGQMQPPIPLAAAIASNPAFAAAVQTGFTAVTTIVQNNLGNLSSSSAANLLTKVSAVAATALPDQVATIAAQAIAAATAPGSAIRENVPTVAAAITQAIVMAAPNKAAQIAAAAVSAVRAQESTLSGSAAKASPTQSSQITTAITQVVLTDGTAMTPAKLQAVAGVAAAVAGAAPSHAAGDSSAAMQQVLKSSPGASALVEGQNAGTIASSVTAAVPSQAVPVAGSMMKLMLQNLPDASSIEVTQVGALVAGGVITSALPQAQPVATAVMQLLMQSAPNASAADILIMATQFATALEQMLPDQASAITEAVAAAANIPTATLNSAVAGASTMPSPAAQQFAGMSSSLSAMASHYAESSAQVNAGADLAGAWAKPNTSFGFGDVADNGHGGTSITLGDNAGNATSIIITQFDPSLVNQIAADVNAAQAAQTSVRFSTETGDDGRPTVRPIPTVPRVLPPDLVTSSSRIHG